MTSESSNHPDPHDRPPGTTGDPVIDAGTTDAADPDLATASPIEEDASDDDDLELPSVVDQRAELAETVDALSDRFDVRERARAEAAAQADHLTQQASEHRTAILGVLGAVGGAAVLLLIRRRRRRREDAGNAR